MSYFDPLMGLVDAEPTPGFEADALALARKIFDGEGQLARVAYVEDPNGRHFFSLPVPHPSRSRLGDMIMQVLAATLARTRAVGLAMLSECWIVAAHKDTPRSALPVDFADADDRREIVVATVEHYDLDGGQTRVWQAEIVRVAGQRPTLGAWRYQNFGNLSGRMIGVLPPRGGAA